jgi:hypothetical protein
VSVPRNARRLQAFSTLQPPLSTLAVVTLVHVCNNDPNATDSGVLGGWWFGASPSSPDSNFLRVHNAFPNRRLSDNALMMPPKIRIAPSCASSPGGTPGGGGLPIRRHSSIGPQERRGSTVNLSPPTVSTKVTYLSLLCVWHSCTQKGGACSARNTSVCHYVALFACDISNWASGLKISI